MQAALLPYRPLICDRPSAQLNSRHVRRCRFRFPSPAPLCPSRHDPPAALAGGAALLNLALQVAFNPMQRLEPVYAAALLALNIVELAALLFLTGGLQNPFSFLFLAPVLISATALPVRMTMALGFVAVACASNLVFYHYPLPWDSDDPLVLPPIYLFGVWLSIVLAIGVTSLYAFQVTEEARKLSDALAATELVLAREQHLTQLDGLAAAAAHELGTPL